MKLTKEQLYADLHSAYLEARRHKRSRDYQQRFERDMYWQLKYLCDELYGRRYEQQPASPSATPRSARSWRQSSVTA